MRIGAVIGWSVLVCLIGLINVSSAKADWVKITFLHTNDVYEISPQDGLGGMAALKTLIDNEKAKSPHSFVTFGGDLLSPSVMSAATKGAQMIDLFNAIGMDFAVPGNHEFDFGSEIARARFDDSHFEWLMANAKVKGEDLPFGLHGSAIIDVEGVKLGLFGIALPETGQVSSAGDDVVFSDAVAAGKTQVEMLKANGADVIVALVHLDFAADKLFAEQVEGLDLVLSGHDHTPRMLYVGDSLVAETGRDAQQLLVVDLLVNKNTEANGMKVEVESNFRLITTRGVAEDKVIAEKVAFYESRFNKQLDKAIGEAGEAFDTRRESVRTKETNFGDLLADALRRAARADIAIVNGGGIRGNDLYQVGQPLTRKDILSELPFNNVMVLMDVSGQVIREVLEAGVSKSPEESGSFPQVSGLSFTYNPARPAGKRVQGVSIGGHELEDKRMYRLATNNFLAEGRGGFDALKKGTLITQSSDGQLISSILIDYIQSQGRAMAGMGGRIQVKK